MNKRIIWLKIIALASVVSALCGCEWDNSLYKGIVDGDTVTFCPPIDEDGKRNPETIDYFYFGQVDKDCSSKNYATCVSDILSQIDEKKEPDLYHRIKNLDYAKSFEMGICPVGFECMQNSLSSEWYCKMNAICKAEEISCDGICLKANELHVVSCKDSDSSDNMNSLIECTPGYIDCDGKIANGCEVSISSTHITSCYEENGEILISECENGYFDCDGIMGNGCEVSTAETHIVGCDKEADVNKILCEPDYLDCDGLIGNGCEVSTAETHIIECVEDDSGVKISCEGGYLDCDGLVGNGCEIIMEQVHIVGCEKDENGITIECDDNYIDCDGLYGNGCEINKSQTHIIECEKAQDELNIVCEQDYLDCDGKIGNGCEVSTQITHITSCQYDDVSVRITDCDTGYADCNGLFEDGCEINTLSSIEYCGADTQCQDGKSCEELEICDGGKCVNGCSLNKCDIGEEKVCVDLKSNDNYCGDCSTNCITGLPMNSKYLGCIDGQCKYQCLDGYSRVENGAKIECINYKTDSNHCGSYDKKCQKNEACLEGKCTVYECNNNESICNVNNKLTCVNVNGSSLSHCGGCNYACKEHLPDPNAEAKTCNNGVCNYSCKGGYENCSTTAKIQCVSKSGMASDNKNCGGCGNKCGQNYACISGSCQLAVCTDNKSLCDINNKRYCADTQSEASNCGTCGYACSAHPLVNATSNSCSSGQCSYQCNTGYTNCGGDKASNIKCINVKSNDVNNCGSCGNKCASTAGTNGTLSGCASGTCKYICKSGFTKCSGTDSAPKCYNLTNDRYHCGTCSKSCPAKAGTNGTFDKCSASACRYKCVSGYTKCSGTDLAPVCYNLKTDVNHCGSCSKKCTKPANAKSVTCQSGTCKITCKSGYKLKNGKCVKS